MKHILFFFLLAASTVSAQQVFHDPDAELRQVGDFNMIDVSSAIDLRLSGGNENAVAVSARNQENRDAIKTEVKNGVLKIWYSPRKWMKGNNGKTRVYVAAKELKKIVASGACDISVSGELKGDELNIVLSGASDFKGAVNMTDLTFQLSGASDAFVKGSVSNLNISASGASHFKGYDLEAENCVVDASGASDINITVNKVLKAEASGATTIQYRGNGQVSEIKTSGASNIKKTG